MGAVEGIVPAMGGGRALDPGEMLFGGGGEDKPVKETEWEVFRSERSREALLCELTRKGRSM
jgi:hypothetical protein